MDGSDMGGLYLKIQPYKSTRTIKPTTTDFSPPVMAGYNRIYAGNLSWDITEDDLKKLFSDCTISSIRFGEDKETGEFKGYAHVDFADHASLTKALKLDQRVVCGRPVRIRCAVPPNKGDVRNAGSSASGAAMKTESVNSTAENENGKVEIENNNNVGVSSGKLRRRTCYECGEKGHISSACPKKQELGQNSGAI